MDKFRIHYKCVKAPKPQTGLEGFEKEGIYTGRSFNGFYEVSAYWGSGKPTKLISKNLFQEHFEIVPSEELVPVKA
jgi:hypothetical protein